MGFDVEKMVKSKEALRRKLAERPISEKLRIAEELSERALATRPDTSPPPPDAPWSIPPHWRWAKMGDVATVAGGGTPPTDRTEYFGGDVPWITPADLSKYSHKTISRGARNITQAGLANSGARVLPEGTVLFSSRAPIGYVAIAANSVATNQGFKSFILREDLLPDFVYYYLQRAKDLVVTLASGTTFLEISGKKAAQIPIPIPPFDEQQRIVAEIEKQFTRLEAGVATLQSMRAKLKRYRASVLKAACEGSLAERKSQSSRHRIGDILTLVNGRAFKPSEWRKSGIPIVRIQNLNDPAAPFNFYGGELPAKFLVNDGDLLFAWSGTPGTSFGAHIWRGGNAWLNQHIFKVQFDDKRFDREFLKIVINNNLNDYIRAAHGGAGLAHITKGKFESHELLVPPLPEQKRIVEEVERRLSVVQEMEAVVSANLQRATRLRQSILQKAFSGKLAAREI